MENIYEIYVVVTALENYWQWSIDCLAVHRVPYTILFNCTCRETRE